MTLSTDRMSRWGSLLVLVVALATLTGCTTALKQAYYEVRGAQGELRFVEQPLPSQVRQFNSFQIEPAQTDLGRALCPLKLREAYRDAAATAVKSQDALWPGGDPTLTISGDIVYFQKKGILSASQLITRVKFKSGNDTFGDALLIVESKSFREGDEEGIADAGIDALMKYLNGVRFPEADTKDKKDRKKDSDEEEQKDEDKD